jgi:O-antigen/teichoic acid export membrane protein
MSSFSFKIPTTYKQLIGNTIIVFGYRIFQKTISFATIFFLIRALTPEQYGEYSFIISLMSFSTLTAIPGLQESVTQSTARGFMGTYRKSQPISFLFSFIGMLALFTTAFWYYTQGNTPLSIGCLITSLLFPFSFGLEQWKGLRKGLEDFKVIVKMGGIFSTIQGTLVILSVLLIPNSYLLPIFIILFIPLLKNVFMTFKAYKLVPANAPIEQDSIKYGYKVTAYSVFNIMANNIDSILLFTLLSPTALAVYTVSNKLPELIKKLVQDVGSVLSPRFAKHKTYTKQTDRYIKLFSLASGVMIIGFAFTLMPPIMVFIFGDVYESSVVYAQIIMCSLAVGNISILQSRYISSKLDAKSYRDITIIMSITRIISSIALIPFYGIWGAIISICIYRLVMVITVQIIMNARYNPKS